MGPNRICSISSSGDKSFYHSDHLGSSNIITNQAGNLIQNCEYLPYGEFSTKTGISTTHYYFTGKELDDETGLMFYGARYYDPQLGRFITPDTIVQSPYDLQSLNRYSYCRNNPLNLTDPTGHFGWKNFWHNLWKDVVNLVAPIVNIGKAILAGDWKTIAIVAISIAANFIIPGSGTLSSNLFLNVALHVIRGAAIGALTGGISSEIMGGNFWQGVKVGMVAGAITGAIQGVTSSEQFKNWTSGNGFRSDDVVKAEQERVANMKALLPQAQSSDGAMQNVLRQQNAGENADIDLGKIVVKGSAGSSSGVAGQMGAELQNDSSFGWKGVYNDIKVSLNAQLNSTEPIIGKGIEWGNIDWQAEKHFYEEQLFCTTPKDWMDLIDSGIAALPYLGILPMKLNESGRSYLLIFICILVLLFIVYSAFFKEMISPIEFRAHYTFFLLIIALIGYIMVEIKNRGK